MNKQILRNKYKEIRKNIKDKSEQDNLIFNKIISLEEYIQKSKKNIQIELSGCRCGNLCQDGPNIFINDKKYSHPTQKELIQILEAL